MTKISTAKPIHTPMVAGLQMSRFTKNKLADPQLYRSIVGALQYATITGLDSTFAVNKVSQFMAEPTETYWQMVKRILRYIQETPFHGLTLKAATNLSLDRRSTTRFVVYFGPNPISWCSKKQPTVSQSSTETEYRSLGVTTFKLFWISSLLKELQYPVSQTPTLGVTTLELHS